jgi:hypothetical protein
MWLEGFYDNIDTALAAPGVDCGCVKPKWPQGDGLDLAPPLRDFSRDALHVDLHGATRRDCKGAVIDPTARSGSV